MVTMSSVGFPSSTPSWHHGKELQDAVNRFHDQHARQPLASIRKAKEILFNILNVIEKYLRDRGLCRRVEPTGSCYQGTKIDDGHLEFDVIIEMDGTGLEVEKLPGRPSHCLLSVTPGKGQRFYQFISRDMGGTEVVSSEKFEHHFYGILSKLNNSGQLGDNIRLRAHGPAVQMDVWNNYELHFSVDIVPSFEVPTFFHSSESFVAKPYKLLANPDISDDSDNQHAWYRSFALEEKMMFDAIDRGSLCKKPAVRVLKASFGRRSELKRLTSYHIKTLLLHYLDGNGRDCPWWPQDQVLAARVMELLGELEDALKKKCLHHYFIPEENLFRNIPDITLDNMYHRVKNLRQSKQAMLDLVAVDGVEGVGGLEHRSFSIQDHLLLRSVCCCLFCIIFVLCTAVFYFSAISYILFH